MNILTRILPVALILFVAGCVGPYPITPSDTGSDLQRVYAAAEANMRGLGKMRTEFSPKDAPFTYGDLVRNFERIALRNEYRITDGRFVATESQTFLRRWQGPVRIATINGVSTPKTTVQRNNSEVAKYTRRLAHLTGLDMRTTTAKDANFLVLFLNAEEQVEFADTLPDILNDISPAVVDAFRNSPRNIFCAAFAFTRPWQKGVYGNVLILVKSEHSDFMRKSCIHEEMAQAMGLTNDSLDARPSIFNDDEEFAFLTRHDEILLRMLYDPRLKAGMESYEVIPLLPAIAQDATP
ncbi:hypothetical protein A9Q96_07910 [Rhodobacterales bacterium 52_120_T64]|nr:hypothetical protein A9Q96_07910 [Rhodobacterales bacterium 52_120_T64]